MPTQRWVATMLLAAALAAASGPAAAQYQWRDEHGRMNFSDRPPLAASRAVQVLRRPSGGTPGGAASIQPALPGEPVRARSSATQPGAAHGIEPVPAGSASTTPAGTPAAPTEAADAAATALRPAPAASAAPSLAERELAFRKRRLDAAQADSKRAEQRARAERAAHACDDSRSAQRALESGMRVARVAESGEREFLGEAERAARLAALRRDIAEQCGG